MVRRAALSIVAVLTGVQVITAGGQREPSLTIKGVGLGSSATQVVRALGKPAKQVRLADDTEMGMGQLEELIYKGVKFELCKPEGKDQFQVWRVIATRSNWLLEPGIKVGMMREDVVRLLGSPLDISNDSHTAHETLHYGFSTRDGWFWLVVANGRVLEIGAAQDWS